MNGKGEVDVRQFLHERPPFQDVVKGQAAGYEADKVEDERDSQGDGCVIECAVQEAAEEPCYEGDNRENRMVLQGNNVRDEAYRKASGHQVSEVKPEKNHHLLPRSHHAWENCSSKRLQSI